MRTKAIQYIKSIGIFSINLFLLIVLSFPTRAFSLSPEARISIITCSPGDEAYSVYGHSAIRVTDPALRFDLVYNYGIFDFSAPNFLYRFAAGQTDYLLGAYSFQHFLEEYRRHKRGVVEQILNLTPKEKQEIFDFLSWNARPENRVYRYNFFFDNCATRVRDVIENHVTDGVSYHSSPSHKTLRQLTKDYHKKLRWLNFGIDFLISAPADQTATLREEMFLPDFVQKHFSTATRGGGNEPLVLATHTLLPAHSHPKSSHLPGPLLVFLILCGLIIVATLRQIQRKNLKPLIDYLLYGAIGFCGWFVSWFVLFSEHPAMHPNYNLLWLLPLHLIFAIGWTQKEWRSVLRYYLLAHSIWILLFLATAPFLPQWFHPIFYIIAFTSGFRSAAHTYLLLKKGSN